MKNLVPIYSAVVLTLEITWAGLFGGLRRVQPQHYRCHNTV